MSLWQILPILRISQIGPWPCLPIAANLLVFVSKKDLEAHFVGFALFASTPFSLLLLPLVFFLQGG